MAVFSQLFRVDGTVMQITVACGFIVVVNAWFSGLLQRRGVSWQNSLIEFGGLLMVNWGALTVYVALRTRFNAELQTGPTLVLLGLLTLIVILHDRYRTIRRTSRAEAIPTQLEAEAK